jgi:hypothetical protein
MNHKKKIVNILDESFVTFEEEGVTSLILDTSTKGTHVQLVFDWGGMLLRVNVLNGGAGA